MNIQTLQDQFELIDVAFSEARNHDKPIAVDGLLFLRKDNRWWDTEKQEVLMNVAQFTDVHSADDEPLSLAALIAHTKDRVQMSVEGSTNSALLRILIQYSGRKKPTGEDQPEVIQDRFLVEFQWVMPLPDGIDVEEPSEEEVPPDPFPVIPL